jgi:hypothetical protein
MSTATGIPAWPSGYSHPTAVISPYDHSGWVTITAALGLCVVLIFFAIRVYIRTAISPKFGLDDIVLSVATVRELSQNIRHPALLIHMQGLHGPTICHSFRRHIRWLREVSSSAGPTEKYEDAKGIVTAYKILHHSRRGQLKTSK